jgi:hypothetical protein
VVVVVGRRKYNASLNFPWTSTSSSSSVCFPWKLGWHKREKETLCYTVVCACTHLCWNSFFLYCAPARFLPSRECHEHRDDLIAAPRKGWGPRCELIGDGFFCLGENEKESLSGRMSPSRKMNVPLSDVEARIHMRGKLFQRLWFFKWLGGSEGVEEGCFVTVHALCVYQFQTKKEKMGKRS